jgi:glycosyltransferase involved in cell wall biosynthesis
MSKDNFIIYSTADWDNPFWTNKQHIASRLAIRGNRIFYIESMGLRAPTVRATDLKRIVKKISAFFKGVRNVSPNVWVYTPPAIPFHRFWLVRLLNNTLLHLILKFYVWKLNFQNHIAWTYNPTVLSLIKRFKPKKIVYHSVDDLSASPGIDKSLIQTKEKELLKEADTVFCTSLKIFNHCNKVAKDKTFYYSNVVDYEHFSKARENLKEPDDLKEISRPRIGFVGAVSEYKVDIELILSIAKKYPHWHWVLIGKVGEGQPGTSIDKLLSFKNVHLLGPKNYNDLPSYISNFDICTIPTPLNDYTNSMFPMKFYEFMAGGKPIVARNIDSLKEVKDAHYSYDDINSFEDQIKKAIEAGVINPELCNTLSRENTWEKRLDKMLTKL